MPSVPAPFVVPDTRTPGLPMAALPLKIPTTAIAQLQHQADRLGCNRGALARALLLRALAELEQSQARDLN